MLKKKKKISPMPSCLHRYTFLQCSLFLFFDEPSSLFLLHKSPQSSQNSSFASFSVSLTETIMVFFLGQKLLQSITLSLCNGCSFLLLFLFFFLVKKKFTKALIAEKKFLPETIQNIDVSSMFDRMLWLKLQQW